MVRLDLSLRKTSSSQVPLRMKMVVRLAGLAGAKSMAPCTVLKSAEPSAATVYAGGVRRRAGRFGGEGPRLRGAGGAGEGEDAGGDLHGVGAAVSELVVVRVDRGGRPAHDDGEEVELRAADGVDLEVFHFVCAASARRSASVVAEERPLGGGRGRDAHVERIDEGVVGGVVDLDPAGGPDRGRRGEGEDEMGVRVDVAGAVGGEEAHAVGGERGSGAAARAGGRRRSVMAARAPAQNARRQDG